MKPRNQLPRKLLDRVMRGFSGAAAVAAVAAMLWIVWTIVVEGGGTLSWSLLTNCSKPYGEYPQGIANAFVGTLAITACAALMAIPPALCAATALAEFGGERRLTHALRFVIDTLAGVPSVIVGLFVYSTVVATTGCFSGISGAIALAILMFPVVTRTTEDCLRGVGIELREAGLALGDTRARTTLAIVFKAARSGIVTGALLAVARVSGETAPLLFTALYADAWPSDFFGGPTPSAAVLITNNTLNSPFAEMHSIGWAAALVLAFAILAVNIAVKFVFKEKK